MSAETIFALASAPGRAGIAVIRVSGPKAAKALARLGVTGPPPPRRAARAVFSDPISGEALDDGLVIWFPAPHSFTGEDVAELHVHGGRAVIDSVLAALAGIGGLRPAEPGEFTRRAFDNDKLDLTQAEALADLVDAETRAQQRQALRQMGGALKELYDDWRQRMVQALAHLEAVIDFPDDDLPADVADKVWGEVRELERRIADHLDDARRGERIREGLSIAILGPPNAGKSSLLNALARREAAIVAATPGTTRDVIEVHMDLGGYAVTLADTAGLRAAGDAIEDEGIRRARRRAEAADIRLIVFDGAVYPARDRETETLIDDASLVVVNKSDLLDQGREWEIDADDGWRVTHFVSVLTGFGLSAMLQRLEALIKTKVEGGALAPLTRARHRRALEECLAALARSQTAALPELAAEDLRLAARALGRLTGRIDVEDVLDAVFRDFCIGK
ncbi:MAG: tRNA uridine-5-carboxymethylaminomethyl(34) synthesis GTPase MnmE [Rhodospirillaceae bacterium]|nr:tRNA uridine-5-carboxymethylaminomethyl(34) synthesis GTPase MnmE [Rhodospirillaceae bacterium]